MIAVIMAVKARRWSGPLCQVVAVVELLSGKKGLLLHPAGRLTLQARYKACGM